VLAKLNGAQVLVDNGNRVDYYIASVAVVIAVLVSFKIALVES
jgi:hypothetical protein